MPDPTELPISERPSHPRYGKALGGREIIVDGTAFYPYRESIMRYVRCSHDGRIVIRNAAQGPGEAFTCWVDGTCLPKRFRKFETAARAGIRYLAGEDE